MRDRLEQIALQDVDTVLDAVEACVLACELDGSRARVRCPHLDVRAVDREGDRDCPLPVPTSATRIGTPSIRSSASSTRRSVDGRGVKTLPGAASSGRS